MADTVLSPTGLVQIEVGASRDTWGGKINANEATINSWFDAGPALKVALGGTGAADAAGARVALGAQAYSDILQNLSAQALAANTLPYGNGDETWALTTLTAAGRALLDDADAAAQRATLGAPGIAALRGHLAGLTLSTAGSSASFSVVAGVAMDSTHAYPMELAAALVKTTSAWAVGDTNGALDTGSIANTTWYHVHLIRRPDTGVVDVLISLSATAPTLPTNYTQFRRIGSLRTNSSAQWTQFVQTGDRFEWVGGPFTDVNGATTANASAVLAALTLAPGVAVEAEVTLSALNTSSNFYASLQSPNVGAVAATQAVAVLSGVIGGGVQLTSKVRLLTNTSRQIYYAATASTTLSIFTWGWLDRRGRDE